jgi:hypothetical protein
MAAPRKQQRLNDWLAGRSFEIAPFSTEYSPGAIAVEGGYQTPLPTISPNIAAGSTQYNDIMAQSVLRGRTPEQYFQDYGNQIGTHKIIDGQGGAEYDPATGMVNYADVDNAGDPWGPYILAAMAAGVGGLAFSGAGLGAAGASGASGAGAGLEAAGAFGGEAFGAAANSAGAFGGSVAPWTAGAAGGLGTNGGGMWDWLDEIIQSGGPDAGAENMFGFEGGGGGVDYAGIDSWLANEGNFANDILGSGPKLPNGTPVDLFLSNASQQLGTSPAQLAKLIASNGGFGSTFGQTNQGSGLLGGIMNDPLGSAFNATPFLLALAQAKSQAGDLDSVINKINGEGYTRAVLNPYDLQTGLGRTGLEQDLSNRGVTGSSFGYQSLNNYDYARDLGRGDLAAKGLMSSAQLEGSLVNQRNLSTNMLLGAGLNASGRLFSPQKDVFGLQSNPLLRQALGLE